MKHQVYPLSVASPAITWRAVSVASPAITWHAVSVVSPAIAWHAMLWWVEHGRDQSYDVITHSTPAPSL